LEADSQNNLNISFYDSFTEKQVTGDVDYDMQILDKDQNVLWSKNDAIAQNGAGTQTVNLPGNGIYGIVIKVKSVFNNGVPDTTRIGMARGNVVIPSTVTENDSLTQTPDNATVPEFGPVASIVLAIAVMSMVVFVAKTRGIPKF